MNILYLQSMAEHVCGPEETLQGVEFYNPHSLKSIALQFFIQLGAEENDQFLEKMPAPLNSELSVLRKMKNTRWTVQSVAAKAEALDGQTVNSNSYDIAMTKLGPPAIGERLSMSEFERENEHFWHITKIGVSNCDDTLLTWSNSWRLLGVDQPQYNFYRSLFKDGKLTMERVSRWENNCDTCGKVLHSSLFLDRQESWTIENDCLVWTCKKVQIWPKDAWLLDSRFLDMALQWKVLGRRNV